MGRKSLKEVRKKEIVESFYVVAKKEGLENASIAKVAKEMGINASLILHYFGTKEDLISELIHFILEQYRIIYTSAHHVKDSKERLLKIVRNLFSRDWNALIDDGVFYSCFALVFRDEKIKTAYLELHEHLRNLLAEAIEEAKAAGTVQIENSKETADLIFIMVEGTYYYLSLYGTENGYTEKLNRYRAEALKLLKLNEAPGS